MSNGQDDPRDAHLLAALRHAPDRDAVPPREVSERILAAARASVRPSHATRTPWWQRLGAWLMQPQVAASFGTLVVASLVGVMWSTREPPVAEFVPSLAAAERLQPSSAPALVAPAQTHAAKPDAPEPEETAAVKGSTAIREARPQSAPAPRPKQVPAKDADKTNARAESRQRAAAEAPAAIAETAATPSAPPPSPAVAAPAPPVADAVVPPSAPARRSASPEDLLALERRQETASAPASSGAVGPSLATKAKAAVDPLVQWDAVLNAGPSGSVRWRVGDRRDAPPVVHGATQQQWWSTLRRATAGTWQPQKRAAQQPLLWLALEGPPQPTASTIASTLSLVEEAVVFCPAAEALCWRAPITPAQREAWIAEIARW